MPSEERRLDAPDQAVPLAEQRRGAVLAVLRSSGARRVADVGCGEGALTAANSSLTALPRSWRPTCHRGTGDRRAAAAPGPDAAAAARPRPADPVRADLPGPAARRVRRDRTDGGDRARRPAAAARFERTSVRRRGARACRRDDAERRVQRQVRVAGPGRDAASRSPVRVDQGRVPAWAERWLPSAATR